MILVFTRNAVIPVLGLSMILCFSTFVAAAGDKPAGDVVELYDPTDGGSLIARPIVLTIPNDLIYGAQAVPHRISGINLMTWLPNMNGNTDPENRDFGLSCAGFCNGRVLITLENRTASLLSGSKNVADFMAKAAFRWVIDRMQPRNVVIERISPASGFTEGYQEAIRNPNGSKPGAPGVYVVRYFFRKDVVSQQYDLYARCNVSASYPACEIRFSLACNVALGVEVSVIRYSDLFKSSEIAKSINDFIRPMVQSPGCSANS